MRFRFKGRSSRNEGNILLLNSLSFCFWVNFWNEGMTTMTTSSLNASLPSTSSSSTVTSLCRSITSSNKSKNRVNFSFAADRFDLSLASSEMACIKGEKLESKYPAFAVRKLELSTSSVDCGMRLGRLWSLGWSRRCSRR